MFDEEQYQMNKWSLWAGGQTIKGTITGLSSSLVTMATGAAGLAFAAAGTVGIVFGAVIHKRILDMEHDREEQRMLGLYRREIAAQTGRSPDQLTHNDLERAASQNTTIAEALERNNRKVKSRMWAWVGGAVLATVVVGLLFTPGLFGAAALLGSLVPATAGLHGAGWAAAFATGAAVKGLIGALTFNVARPFVDNLSDKIASLNGHDTHEYIEELSKIRSQGRTILPEQVLGAFVKASPALDESIKQRYGHHFDKLVLKNDFGALKEILSEMDSRFNITQVTNDINAGRIQVTELAYIVRGQRSGVEPVEPDTRTAKEKIKDGIDIAKQKVEEASVAAQEKLQDVKAQVSQAWQDGREKLASKFRRNHNPDGTFVERTGRADGPNGQGSFTDRVDAKRSPAIPGVPSK